MLRPMRTGMKVVLFGAALSASVCVGEIMLYRATVTTEQESPFHSAILNSIPNPFNIFGGGIKNACLKFDEEMSANLKSNPKRCLKR